MKPVFVNNFTVAAAKNKSEITLTFSHIYTEQSLTQQGGSLTNVSAPVVDTVSRVVLTRESTVELAKVLKRMTDDWGIDLGD